MLKRNFALAAVVICGLLHDGMICAQEPTKWQYSSESMQPFWIGTRVENEPILFIRDEQTGQTRGSVLFPIRQIIAVRNSAGQVLYQQGVDYQFEKGSREIVLPTGSKVVSVLPSALRRPANSQPHRLTHRDGNGEILFGAKLEYHRMQTWVTYEKDDSTWPVSMPAFDPERLPKSVSKLKDGKRLSIVLLGDSISTGCNASAWGGGPPFQPAYQDLLVTHLRAHYQATVTLENLSVGGTATPWGIDMTDKVIQQNPDLVILAFGMNDSAGRSAAEYGQNVEAMITAIRSSRPLTEFILVAPMLGNRDWTALHHDVFPAYRDQLRSLSGPGIAIADMTTVWDEMLRRKQDADLTGNGVNHPNDFGHRVYAQVLAALLVEPAPSTE